MLTYLTRDLVSQLIVFRMKSIDFGFGLHQLAKKEGDGKGKTLK